MSNVCFGKSVFESHQIVLTESLTLIFRLFTHSIGEGSFDGLCQKNSSASRNPFRHTAELGPGNYRVSE